MKAHLSTRIRPNSEAAPWVIEEVRKLEAEVERLRGIVEVNDQRLAAVWDEARVEVERLKLALKTAKQRLNNMDSGEDVYWVES